MLPDVVYRRLLIPENQPHTLSNRQEDPHPEDRTPPSLLEYALCCAVVWSSPLCARPGQQSMPRPFPPTPLATPSIPSRRIIHIHIDPHPPTFFLSTSAQTILSFSLSLSTCHIIRSICFSWLSSPPFTNQAHDSKLSQHSTPLDPILSLAIAANQSSPVRVARI